MSRDDAAAATWKLDRDRRTPQVQSLNLAAAAGILVAELARLAGPAPPLDDAAAASLATDLLSQRDAWHTPQRRLRRRTAAAARGEIFRQRRRAEFG